MKSQNEPVVTKLLEEKNNWQFQITQLKKTANEKQITQTEIALRTGLKRSNVSRFFNLKYCPSLELFLKISNALEIEISLDSIKNL